jgi:hypothetical protein
VQGGILMAPRARKETTKRLQRRGEPATLGCMLL